MNVTVALLNTPPQRSQHKPKGADLRASVYAILQMNTLCTLATTNADCTPHCNTAYYAADEGTLNLYLLTPPTAKHSQNLQANSKAALTIFDSQQPWGEPHRGLQMTGSCTEAGPEDAEHAFEVYSRRHPELLSLVPEGTHLDAQLESRFYLFIPELIKVIDEVRYGPETSFTLKVDRRPN